MLWSALQTWLVANWTYVAPVVGILLAWWLNTRLPVQVKLRFGRANNSFHKLNPPDADEINVYCEKLYIQNAGIKPATNVEVAFTAEPTGISTYPPLKYNTGYNPEGKYIVTIDAISPKELVIIDTIHVNSRTAEILSVRSKEGSGKPVNFWVTRKFGQPVNYFFGCIFLLGGYYAAFLVVSFVAAALGGAP